MVTLLINISSTALVLSTVIVLRALVDLLDYFLFLVFYYLFSVLLSFFSIPNNNIHYLFSEICDLSGDFWSETPFSVSQIISSGFLSTKWLWTYWCGLLQSLMILVGDEKYNGFHPTFQLPPILSHCKHKPFIKFTTNIG